MLLWTLGSRQCAHVWLEDAAQRCQRGLQLASVTLQFRLTAVSLSGHGSGATCGAYIQGLGASHVEQGSGCNAQCTCRPWGAALKHCAVLVPTSALEAALRAVFCRRVR